MKCSFECSITSDILEKFKIALQLNNDDADEIIEKLMMHYISSSFSVASQAYRPINLMKDLVGVGSISNVDTGKAVNRIPKWAFKSEQNNHKIIKAFFELESELGHVGLTELENRCSEKDLYPKTFVRDFKGNFNQMKIDSPKSHGKVFEVEKGEVIIWDKVSEILNEYRKYFI